MQNNQPNPFTILLASFKPDEKPKLEELKTIVEMCLQKILPISPVDYSSFVQSTSHAEIPIYIMDRKNEMRQDKIDDLSALRTKFRPVSFLGKYKPEYRDRFNPRYATVDIHLIQPERHSSEKEVYLVRISISRHLPVSLFLIMRQLAKLVSHKAICDVLSLDMATNGTFEAACKFAGGNLVSHAIEKYGSSLIGRYTKEAGYSINKILLQVDYNLDVMMAATDLTEYEEMKVAYSSSKEFLEESGLAETREYADAMSLIATCDDNIAQVKQMLVRDPNMISLYFRFYDPRQLEKFKMFELKSDMTRQFEEWG